MILFSEKAPAPKAVTVSGITTFVSLFPWNALSPMSVTAAPNPISTKLLYSKAFFPIFVTVSGIDTVSIPFGE